MNENRPQTRIALTLDILWLWVIFIQKLLLFYKWIVHKDKPRTLNMSSPILDNLLPSNIREEPGRYTERMLLFQELEYMATEPTGRNWWVGREEHSSRCEWEAAALAFLPLLPSKDVCQSSWSAVGCVNTGHIEKMERGSLMGLWTLRQDDVNV